MISSILAPICDQRSPCEYPYQELGSSIGLTKLGEVAEGGVSMLRETYLAPQKPLPTLSKRFLRKKRFHILTCNLCNHFLVRYEANKSIFAGQPSSSEIPERGLRSKRPAF